MCDTHPEPLVGWRTEGGDDAVERVRRGLEPPHAHGGVRDADEPGVALADGLDRGLDVVLVEASPARVLPPGETLLIQLSLFFSLLFLFFYLESCS